MVAPVDVLVDQLEPVHRSKVIRLSWRRWNVRPLPIWYVAL